MAVLFLLLVVIAQATFFLVARQIAAAATTATAREVARPGAQLDQERHGLLADIRATVPGALDPEAEVRIEGDVARATLTFAWRPPGPDMLRVTVSIDSESTLVFVP